MHTMTSTEFARNPRAVYDRVLETQEAVEITRHGKPVVRVEPVKQKKGISGAELVARLLENKRKYGHVDDPTFLEDCQSASLYEEIRDPWDR